MIDLTTDASSDIGLFEAIYSARSLRHFKPDPVPEALIARVIDAAIRASSGGNTQHWYFIVVRDAEKRRQLGALYRKASDHASAIYAARPKPDHLTEEQYGQFLANSGFLWDHMADAPVILVPCLIKREPPDRASLPGTVQVHGTPAEEGPSGKTLLLRAGVFDHLDVALIFHPSSDANVLERMRTGQGIRVDFAAGRTPGLAAMRMQEELEALLGRPVDLLTRTGLMRTGNARLRRRILQSAEPFLPS